MLSTSWATNSRRVPQPWRGSMSSAVRPASGVVSSPNHVAGLEARGCSCGGTCPRCSESEEATGAEFPVRVSQAASPAIQRKAANGEQDAAPQQSDDRESSGEMCGPGVIDGQVYMCCFKDAPIDSPCWQVRARVFDECHAKSAKDHAAYERCLGESNFAACRCLGKPQCTCGGIV